jgi:hypothetical protein
MFCHVVLDPPLPLRLLHKVSSFHPAVLTCDTAILTVLILVFAPSPRYRIAPGIGHLFRTVDPGAEAKTSGVKISFDVFVQMIPIVTG